MWQSIFRHVATPGFVRRGTSADGKGTYYPGLEKSGFCRQHLEITLIEVSESATCIRSYLRIFDLSIPGKVGPAPTAPLEAPRLCSNNGPGKVIGLLCVAAVLAFGELLGPVKQMQTHRVLNGHPRDLLDCCSGLQAQS